MSSWHIVDYCQCPLLWLESRRDLNPHPRLVLAALSRPPSPSALSIGRLDNADYDTVVILTPVTEVQRISALLIARRVKAGLTEQSDRLDAAADRVEDVQETLAAL